MAISLKAARVNAGFTQNELAKRLGVSKVTYWKWETGKAEPKFSKYQQICDLCGVKAEDIFLPTT